MAVRMSSIQFLSNYRESLNKTYQKQQRLFEQADGSSIHKGSDDPIAYSSLLRYHFSKAENTQYTSNVDNAISWMKTSDSTISHMADNIQTFVAKTNQAANTYLSDPDAQSIAKEMNAVIEEIMSNCNQQLGDRYLFAGQKDTTQPFIMSNGTALRGVAKNLDAHQASFFKDTAGNVNTELYQMLTLRDDETGDLYYLDTESGYIFDRDFIETGFKDIIAAGYPKVYSETADGNTVEENYSVGKMAEGFKVADAFNANGVLRSDLSADDVSDAVVTVESATKDAEGNTLYDVSGINVTLNGEAKELSFVAIRQRIVTYQGDDNYIAMVKLNGATDRNSDVVNLTGQDMFGKDIFDNENSGNSQSGTAMLNNMLTVYEKVNGNDVHWLSSDGITLSDVAHSTLTISQTTIGARLQLYSNVKDMLDRQSNIITEDISNVSGADVALLATRLMELTTLYNLALSLGGRVLPQSLADYLR